MKNSNVSDLFISVDIKKILKVDELAEVFKIKFNLYITWNDPRLIYQNLKKDPNLNVLRLEGQKNIWAPVIIFENTEDSDQSKIDDKSLIRVLPNKDFNYKKSDKSEIRNTYYFQDPEDVLQLSRTYKIDFLCSYNMALFPFDTQTCSMNFQLDEVTQPHLMAYTYRIIVPKAIIPWIFNHKHIPVSDKYLIENRNPSPQFSSVYPTRISILFPLRFHMPLLSCKWLRWPTLAHWN